MAIFKFSIDEKQTIWQRLHYKVEANSEEEAKELILKEMEEINLPDNLPVQFQESEFLFDTIEYMAVEENGGNPTRELLNEDGETISTNA